MKLLIDPHGDDAALFCAYTCIAEKPHVLVTHLTVPIRELARAMDALDCDWTVTDDPYDFYEQATVVYAPIERSDGHQDHNYAARSAARHFYANKTLHAYLTYAPRGQRDRNGTEVIPPPGAVAKKLRALSCYESQIEQESTRPWFTSLLDMREWIG